MECQCKVCNQIININQNTLIWNHYYVCSNDCYEEIKQWCMEFDLEILNNND